MSRERIDTMNRLLGQQDAYCEMLKLITAACASTATDTPTWIALNALGDVAFRNSTDAAHRVNALAADMQAEMAIERAAA